MLASTSQSSSVLRRLAAPWRLCQRLVADRRGVTLAIVGLGLVSILGFAGLGTEVGMWYFTRRALQGAADSAAYSAALAKLNGASKDIYTTEAKGVTSKYGFVNATNGVTVTVNNPPTSGSYTTNNNAIEVIVTQPETAAISGIFMSTAPTIRARAVALVGATGNGCVLALDKANVTDVFNNGNTTVSFPNCDLYVNSPSASAVNLVGQATINAHAAYISGGVSTSGQGALNTSAGTSTGVAPIADPYAGVTMPTPGASSGSITKDGTYNPGTYGSISCNGCNITLNPGVYVIDSGDLDLGAHATLTGNNVTIVLTSSNGSYGNVKVRSGSTMTLTAPTTGDTKGIAVFEDRNASSSSQSWAGGTSTQVTGVIYSANSPVTYAGGTTTGGAICTQLVASTIDFKGNAAFQNNCGGVAGVKTIGNSPTTLVE